MNISDLKETQKEFDGNYPQLEHWRQRITFDTLDVLNFLLLSTAGEVGEACNITKKIIRGDFSLNDKREDLIEEIIDAFIYILKLSYQLDFDIEEEYFNKLKKNKKKFSGNIGDN